MTPKYLKKCLCCDLVETPMAFPNGGDFCRGCLRDFERWEKEAERIAFAKMAGRIRSLDITEPAIRRALEVAASEGRLDPGLAMQIGAETGSFRCGVCGMLNWTSDEANDCCLPGLEEHARTNQRGPGGGSATWDYLDGVRG